MADSVGMQDLRAENVDKIVKGFALQEYKFKQVCMVQSSNSWKETYYQETSTELSGGTGSNIKGVPRLANFPYGEPTWTRTSSYLVKFAMEGVISWEDVSTNEIDVQARTLLRISRAVAKSVDDHIWDIISESQSVSNINSVTIASGNEWDSATAANRDALANILSGMQLIEESNYDMSTGGFLLVSPKGYADLMGNAVVRNASQQFAEDVVSNGAVGRIAGLTIVKSNSVTRDYAMVIKGGEAATFKEASPLKTETIYDPGVKYTIRAWEVGVCQLVNPKAVTLLVNTQA